MVRIFLERRDKTRFKTGNDPSYLQKDNFYNSLHIDPMVFTGQMNRVHHHGGKH